MSAQQPAPKPNPNAPLQGVANTVDEMGMRAIIWVLYVVTTTFVVLRLAVRFRQNGKFLYDDCWIIFAWLAYTTNDILQTIQLPYLWYITYLKAGRIVSGTETVYMLMQLTRWQFPIIKLFWTILWSVKASFLAVFYRFVKPFPILRRLWWAVAAFALLAYIGCWLASSLTCSPPSDYFKPGKCNSPHELWMQKLNVVYSTTVDISSDVMIMALPISILPSLQLDLRRKIGLAVAFSLGFIIIAVACVRMTQVLTPSGTVDLIGLAIWGAVETSAAIIVGCLPPLKALLSREVKKYSTRGKTTYGQGGTSGGSPGRTGYGAHSVARTVMAAEAIPLDGQHQQQQMDGGIYVQRTYHTTVEFDGDTSSREGDEVGIIKQNGRHDVPV
ncbi:hypothetical protein VTJ83DRAFT_5351 [Remersonia thermophila]|uniref:Rhodopsin domain-containing protein n=1 Tax=Remersonia thermophila TaxID=72144 RepID=A0ABR4D7I7_9PEZI